MRQNPDGPLFFVEDKMNDVSINFTVCRLVEQEIVCHVEDGDCTDLDLSVCTEIYILRKFGLDIDQ